MHNPSRDWGGSKAADPHEGYGDDCNRLLPPLSTISSVSLRASSSEVSASAASRRRRITAERSGGLDSCANGDLCTPSKSAAETQHLTVDRLLTRRLAAQHVGSRG